MARSYNDSELLSDLARAAAEVGQPLTSTAYDAWQRGRDAASPALLVRRFGSWNHACERAGVQTNRTRSTSRRWSEDDILAVVADYLAEPASTGSFAGYSSWAKERPDAPSGATLRQRYAWSDLKKRSLENFTGDA